MVQELLHEILYTTQAKRKIKESGSQHPDRSDPFAFINNNVKLYKGENLSDGRIDVQGRSD
jgi:hypothetical protein